MIDQNTKPHCGVPLLALLFKVIAATFLSIISFYDSVAQISWTQPEDVAESALGNNSPRIQINGSGEVLVLWGNDGDVYFSQRTSDGFLAPLTLNPSGVDVAQSYWMGPEMAASGDNVFVVFKQIPENSVNSHVYCMRSVDGGVNFSDTVRVDDIGDNLSRFPTISTDGDMPTVAFMKFESGFAEPHWVVATSKNGGNSFEQDVAIGEPSSSVAEACDCCPGSISTGGGKMAITYRNNDDNIRDIWTGFGAIENRFLDTSVDIDGSGWSIFSCPASGPDAFILGDTLYTVFMNGASGNKRVYMSRLSVITGERDGPYLLSDDLTGVGFQDYPRISNYQNSTAVVWKQIRNSNVELAIGYKKQISTGQLHYLESLDVNNARNADIAIHKDSVYIVWQDNASRTVKFIAGSLSNVAGVPEQRKVELVVYPNPTTINWVVTDLAPGDNWSLINSYGQQIAVGEVLSTTMQFEAKNYPSGTYWLKIQGSKGVGTVLLIKN